MNRKLKIWIILISILVAYDTYICIRANYMWYSFVHAFDKKVDSKESNAAKHSSKNW